VAKRATVVRDGLGVPHITAESWEDAIFLQAYVTAQDRMWQMDAIRRLAAGELAEVAGAAALESDREARRMLLPRVADAQEGLLNPEARRIYAAYARGVNFYLETHRGRLPLEFTLLNYHPRPWRLRDSVLVGLQMYRTLTPSWRDEIRRLRLSERGDADKLAYLYAAGAGGGVLPGSNAWAVSGKHSSTGKPILANDTHLEFTLPSTWYQVHLRAPDLDVAGMSLPGIPAVIIGHNRRIAWGVTNLGFDVQDLYDEQIDPLTGRYMYRGALEQARPEREPIAVKGGRAVDGVAWVTRHGPVFLTEAGRSYALRWAASDIPIREFPFLDLNRAGNWEEFNAALKGYAGPAQNFVYADVDGNIGYHAAGALPIRQGCDGSLPAGGQRGECEWTGVIPYEDLPGVYNPPAGMIVSANQNPFPENYRYPVHMIHQFHSGYRAGGIRALLASREKWTPEQMLEVQKDVYSAFGSFLAEQLVKAWAAKPTSSQQLKEAVDLLRSWNGQMEKGTAAPMVIALLTSALQTAIVGSAVQGAAADDASVAIPAVIEKLFRERPPGWFASYEQTLVDALARAVAEGEKLQGSKVSAWDYGQWMQLTIPHPVAGRLPLVGRFFNIGPVSMSGSSTTIKQTTRRLAPSMRMVVDLANLDNSLANVTIGQSGHWFSKHYNDQWDAYYSGRSFPMQFEKVEPADTLAVTPR
jgi:penicillin amidase